MRERAGLRTDADWSMASRESSLEHRGPHLLPKADYIRRVYRMLLSFISVYIKGSTLRVADLDKDPRYLQWGFTVAFISFIPSYTATYRPSSRLSNTEGRFIRNGVSAFSVASF